MEATLKGLYQLALVMGHEDCSARQKLGKLKDLIRLGKQIHQDIETLRNRMNHYQLEIDVPVINSIRGTKTGEAHENAEKDRSHTPHRVINLTQRDTPLGGS
jgi:hypothetical protein